MEDFEIKNKIHELKSLIASDWIDIEERKRMYAEIKELESKLLDISCNSKNGS
jgi:hypothetical protein